MALDLNWGTFDDEEFVELLRNSEGKNQFERAMFLEAAKRIEKLSEILDDHNEMAMGKDY